MAKPRSFTFAVKDGDPVRLATAFRDIVAALEPLTDAEAGDVVRELAKMYGPAKPRPEPTTVPGSGVRRG